MDKLRYYFPNLDATQQKQFEMLKELYAYWNAQINVISRKDMDAFYERHVLHALGISKILSFKKGTTILDVGTGGGASTLGTTPDFDFGTGGGASTSVTAPGFDFGTGGGTPSFICCC